MSDNFEIVSIHILCQSKNIKFQVESKLNKQTKMDCNFLSKRKRDSTDDSSQTSSLEVLKRLKPNVSDLHFKNKFIANKLTNSFKQINPTYIEAARRILEVRNIALKLNQFLNCIHSKENNENGYNYIDNKIESPFKDITNTRTSNKLKHRFSMIPKASFKSRIPSSTRSVQAMQTCTDLIVSLNSIAYLAARNRINNFFHIIHTESMNQLFEEQLDEFHF